jgi:hypothetical protein
MSRSSTADLQEPGLFRRSVLEESDVAGSSISVDIKSGALTQGTVSGSSTADLR